MRVHVIETGPVVFREAFVNRPEHPLLRILVDTLIPTHDPAAEEHLAPREPVAV